MCKQVGKIKAHMDTRMLHQVDFNNFLNNWSITKPWVYANILLHKHNGKFRKRGFNMEPYSPIRNRGREILIFHVWKGSNRISFRHQSITRLINELYIKRMLWIQYLGYQFSFLVFFLTLRKQCKPIFL